MSPLPHDPLSVVPPTTSSTCSTSSLSPFISQPIVLDNGPSIPSPDPTPKEAPNPFEHVSEDMSDLDDSEPEDDLSSLLNYMTSIPIPQTPTQAKELMRQAFVKRKSAVHKSELADAALKVALLKAKLCRSRAQHAKHVSDAANVYIENVRWTVRGSKHKSVLSKRAHRVKTVTDPVVPATHIVNLPGGGSMAVILD